MKPRPRQTNETKEGRRDPKNTGREEEEEDDEEEKPPEKMAAAARGRERKQKQAHTINSLGFFFMVIPCVFF